MRHTEVFTGRIGRIQDLFEFDNGGCVVNFSVAETPRIKKGDEWVDGTPIWTDVALFGDEARNFVKSDIKPGTFVTVIGTRTAREYTTKDSQEKRIAQSITAEQVAVAITKFNYVEKMGSINWKQAGTQQAQAPQNAYNQTQPQPQQAADPFAGQPQDTSANPFGSQQAADPFGETDDPFGGSDNPFGDSDNPFQL